MILYIHIIYTYTLYYIYILLWGACAPIIWGSKSLVSGCFLLPAKATPARAGFAVDHLNARHILGRSAPKWDQRITVAPCQRRKMKGQLKEKVNHLKISSLVSLVPAWQLREKWIFTQKCRFFKERTWGISEMAMSSDPDHHFVHGFQERERERKNNTFPGCHVLHDVRKIPIFLTSIPWSCSFAWPVVSSCFSFKCVFLPWQI